MGETTEDAPVESCGASKTQLTAEPRTTEGAVWLSTNRETIEAYNAHVEREGVFSESLRAF
ncbi:type II toxin-antitoxin system CcdA family antitoxin [Myxococcota bacterium]|nr:type II toxin-antitoxin system CcdA family antitoxin [Myxococcota bacterium]